MTNEIKLDGITHATSTQKPIKHDETTDCNKHNDLNDKDVKVTSQFSHLVADCHTDTENKAHVAALKSKVQSGNYEIDTNKLSASIYHNLFNQKAG